MWIRQRCTTILFSYFKEATKEKKYSSVPARGNKAVKQDPELQGHILVIHPTNNRPKLQPSSSQYFQIFVSRIALSIKQ